MDRRSFLHAVPAALAAVSVPAIAAAIPTRTPVEELEHAIVIMKAAMDRIHGEGVRIIRNEDHAVCFLGPDRPRIVEWTGTGHYEVEISDNLHPIYLVERAPEYDSVSEGRCFRLTPRDAKHLGIHFNFEHYLRTVLIRKV